MNFEIKDGVFVKAKLSENDLHIAIPGGICEIAPLAFAGCDHITSIRLPVGLRRIGRGAFEPNVQLISNDLPCEAISEAQIPPEEEDDELYDWD